MSLDEKEITSRAMKRICIRMFEQNFHIFSYLCTNKYSNYIGTKIVEVRGMILESGGKSCLYRDTFANAHTRPNRANL